MQKIKSTNSIANQFSGIVTTELKNGIYFLKIMDKKGNLVLTKKMVKSNNSKTLEK